MAERNTGPVKPPVLDLSARDTTPKAEDAKPEAGKSRAETAGEPADGAARPAAENPPVTAGFHWGAAAAGIAGGALLGTAITYGLLIAGAVPLPGPSDNPRIAALEKRLADATEHSQATINTLTQRFGTLQNDFTARLEAVTALKQAPGGVAPDLTPLREEIAALQARVESLSAGGGGAASETLNQDVTSLRQGLADLSGKLGTLEDKVGTTDSKVAELSAEAQKAPEPATVQAPLLISSLESAFADGRPFAAELASLQAIAPDIAVSPALAAAAPQGLERPDALARGFAAVLPDMLAATPTRPDAGWGEAALDWAKSLLALRPSGEIAGTTPEALVSQLEAALNRRDFARAHALFGQLPSAMQAPAAELDGKIALQAEGAALIQALRSKALGTTP